MKIKRYQEGPPPGRAGAPARPKSDMEAAVERGRSRYVHLLCGHLTDWDTDAAYRMQGSPRNKFFCESCGRWVKPKPPYRSAPVPAQPLF